jgi:hypothetical protein
MCYQARQFFFGSFFSMRNGAKLDLPAALDEAEGGELAFKENPKNARLKAKKGAEKLAFREIQE